jgi:hypothetical protein
MNNQTILVKVRQRLNKLSSFDYDNIETWMILEAFNKAQLEFARRRIKNGEVNKQDLEDIQVLITKPFELKGRLDTYYYESVTIPSDLLSVNRVDCKASTEKCSPRDMNVYLGEEANLSELLKDPNKNPNFDWAETFYTLSNNKIRIYTDNKFKISEVFLVYYKKPKNIKIAGIFDLETQQIAVTEQECVFKEDVVELLIDETCMILSGDIESFNIMQKTTQTIQRNE